MSRGWKGGPCLIVRIISWFLPQSFSPSHLIFSHVSFFFSLPCLSSTSHPVSLFRAFFWSRYKKPWNPLSCDTHIFIPHLLTSRLNEETSVLSVRPLVWSPILPTPIFTFMIIFIIFFICVSSPALFLCIPLSLSFLSKFSHLFFIIFAFLSPSLPSTANFRSS